MPIPASYLMRGTVDGPSEGPAATPLPEGRDLQRLALLAVLATVYLAALGG